MSDLTPPPQFAPVPTPEMIEAMRAECLEIEGGNTMTRAEVVALRDLLCPEGSDLRARFDYLVATKVRDGLARALANVRDKVAGPGIVVASNVPDTLKNGHHPG